MPKYAPRRHPKTASPPDRPRRTGLVTRWEPGESYGFITADEDGRTWFVSRTPGVPELERGAAVTFTGSGLPPAGKRYPNAWSVQPVAR